MRSHPLLVGARQTDRCHRAVDGRGPAVQLLKCMLICRLGVAAVILLVIPGATGLLGGAADARAQVPAPKADAIQHGVPDPAGPAGTNRSGISFHDPFRGSFDSGWSWIREDRAGWRMTETGLEIRVQPGNMWGGSNNARNVLVRAAPDPGEREVTVSVTLTNRPTEQYEQVDLVWYYDDSHMVKLGQELVDGKLSIVMGREEADQTRTIAILPLDAFAVTVRFRVHGDRIQGDFLTPGSAGWTLAGSCDLPAKGAPRISLQCYQGPARFEHWARLTEFRIQQ
jgi:regulation of enolase protein 1 (concanavalin A-like superfamily)